MCAGTTAAALAGSHASMSDSTGTQCQVLPSAPSSAPSTPNPGGAESTGPGSSPGGASSTPPSANPTQICVAVTAMTASVHPGDTAQYSITVTSENGTSGDVTVQISLPPGQTTPGLPDPEFNICDKGDGSQVCTLPTLHAGQSNQSEAELTVPSKAASGDTVTLAAKVTAAAPGADSTGSATGSATASVVATSSTSPGGGGGHTGGGGSGSHHHTGGSGSGGSGSGGSGSGGSGNSGGSTTSDTQPFDTLPPLLGSGTGTGTSSTSGGGDSSNLFPTIGPSSSSPSPGTQGKSSHKPYKATTVADILPLNTGQISGQLAGLIVLALGIVLVFARISLRKPRSSDSKE